MDVLRPVEQESGWGPYSGFHFGPPDWGTADQCGSAIGSVRPPYWRANNWPIFGESVARTAVLTVELWTQS